MRLKLFILTSAFVVAVGTWFCQGKEVYTIRKRSWPSYDVFKVPASKCAVNAVTNCTSYNNAVPEQRELCTCMCLYYAGTFGFYSGSWTCLSNAKVRRQPGCQFVFHADFFGKEIADDPLMVLEQDTSYHALFPSRSCSIDYTSSRYFDCDGTWKALRSKERSKFVSITNKQRFHWDSVLRDSWKYTLKMSTTTSLTGRIVSLYFNCTTPSRSSCLLFKIAGEITCPVVVHPLSTTPIVTATLTTTIQSNFTKSPDPGNQTRHGHHEGGSSSSSSSLSGTMVAVVVIVIFVIIIAVVIGFIFWKKTRGENVLLMDTMLAIVKKNRTPSTTPAVADEAAEEEVYSEIPDHLVQRQPTRTEMLVGSAGTNNYAFQGPLPQPIYASPEARYASLVRNSRIQEEPSTDEEGYLEPRQMPVYVEFESIEEQATETGSADNSKTKNDEGQNRNEQQDASNRSGEGVGVTPVIYSCVNKKRKLPNVPPNDDSTGQDKNEH